MKREFKKKKRNSANRNPKPVILIIAEGKNVTETVYFNSFQNQHSRYSIRILSVGHETDPQNMLMRIEDFWKKQELKAENGDRAFVVLDLDCDDKKADLIKKLSQKSTNTRFIVSNPCFEVWFLLHFRYSTHSYLNSNEVIADLKSYIPNYEKTTDISCKIINNIDIAIDNAFKLKSYYDSLERKWPSNDCNPRTDVPIIIDYFM